MEPHLMPLALVVGVVAVSLSINLIHYGNGGRIANNHHTHNTGEAEESGH